MEENKNQQVETKKPTYEELEVKVSQLTNQLNQVIMRVQVLDNTFRRLDYLFKVVENRVGFSSAFADKCSQEIEYLMTPAEENKEVEKTTEE